MAVNFKFEYSSQKCSISFSPGRVWNAKYLLCHDFVGPNKKSQNILLFQ